MLTEKHESQQGFTLVELLVVMAIGALLLTAIVTSFSAILQTQSRVQGYEEVQETLRFTTALMTQSLRRAEVTEVSDTSLTIKRTSAGSTRDCLGNEVENNEYDWEETFTTVGRTLVCEVDGDHLPDVVSEVVAYEVESLSFQCAPYINTAPAVFDACGNFSGAVHRIIAVQINIELSLDATQTGLNDFEHIFTITLRRYLNKCAEGPEDENEPNECL